MLEDRLIEKEFERANSRIDSLKSEFSAEFNSTHRDQYKLEERIRSLEVRQTLAESNINSLTADMQSIKRDTRWILRLIIGAIVVALLGLVIQSGGGPV